MILHGNCLDKMKELADNSVDSIVTDPPYGLSFMGKKWDYDVPSKEVWQECLRVLKPGGYLLSFAGTRTQHRMAVNIEDAGFEIRDMIAWVYGSGFPKSLNIGKAVDKMQGNEREVSRVRTDGAGNATSENNMYDADHKFVATKVFNETKGTSEYEGWGTALKPALEPITVARKPLAEKTVAENVLKYGTGGINIDGSRVGIEEMGGGIIKSSLGRRTNEGGEHQDFKATESIGRFPANLIHDGSDEVVSLFPDSKSGGGKRRPHDWNTDVYGMRGGASDYEMAANYGSAARFFYCAKASKADRDEGLEGFEDKELKSLGDFEGTPEHAPKLNIVRKNNHPTVKPTKLMQYLVKLVTPPRVPYCPNCANVLELGYGTKTMQELQQPNNGERQTGQTEELLQQEMLNGLDGETEKKTLDNDDQGLSFSDDARTPESEVLRVHNATPPSDGTTSREVLGGGRSSTPPERNQGRQQGGESTSIEETDSRQTTETQSKTNSVSALPQNDKSIGSCQKCGEALAWKKGVVLDCFMGSGSTGKACKLEGFEFIGIEMDADYIEIAKARIEAVNNLL